MKHSSFLTAAALGAGLLLLHDVSLGHGATYRGPGDTVPPGGGGQGGAGPFSPTPSGPSTPTPTGPSTPSPTDPSTGPGSEGGPGGGAQSTGAVGGPDLTQWTFWWEFNKDPYLQLKEHIQSTIRTNSAEFFTGRGSGDAKDTLRPSEQMIRERVVPALLSTLMTEANNDIVTGCLMALAKIGDIKSEGGESEFQEAIQPFLRDKNQEISETAAVALGILANNASVPTLIDLVEDTPAGRELVGQQEVNYRTRAYAAYGLALTGKRTASNEVRQKIVEALFRTLDSDRTRTKDLKSACVIGLGLVPIEEESYEPGLGEGQANEGAKGTIPVIYRRGQIEALLNCFKNDKNHEVVRAHVPAALSRLTEDLSPERFEALKEQIVPALLQATTREAKEKPEVVQSAVYALGLFGDNDADALDKSIRKTLLDISALRDEQAKYFSRIALAYAGSRMGKGKEPGAGIEEVRAFFVEHLGKSAKGAYNIKAWTGLGTGIFGRRLAAVNHPQAFLGEALREALADTKNPREVGALAISMGILGDPDSKQLLRERLGQTRDEQALGYLCLAVGMLNDTEAKAEVKAIVETSMYRPELLRQSAISLGLLGDKEMVGLLVGMLGEAKTLYSQASLAPALGFIGDRGSIDPLIAILQDGGKAPLARGFAAAALGIVSDKENLPWNSKIAVDLNYRASTETLHKPDTATGILNIL